MSDLTHTHLIKYSPSEFTRDSVAHINDLNIKADDDCVYWLNTYGMTHQTFFHQVIAKNGLDDFLKTLLNTSEHSNKIIELDNALFITIKVISDSSQLETEQMVFVLTPNAVWSIQEKIGSHFEWIRERLKHRKGLSRLKKADYLMFLLMGSLIDNYENTYQKMSEFNGALLEVTKIKPTPDFMKLIEEKKRGLLTLKRAAVSLRNTIVKIESIENIDIERKYFTELKEQGSHLIADIDSELLELDSKINLIFSIQGHHLNEVMKTLTVFSVVFIPLTFLAGIYGMNFEYMPELKWRYGYFALLGVMLAITIVIIVFFKRKKWFS